MNIERRMMNLVCIQTIGSQVQVQRIRHVDAEELVRDGKAIYVSKQVWRNATDHDKRVRNAAAHIYSRKKGSARGRGKSSVAARSSFAQ